MFLTLDLLWRKTWINLCESFPLLLFPVSSFLCKKTDMLFCFIKISHWNALVPMVFLVHKSRTVLKWSVNLTPCFVKWKKKTKKKYVCLNWLQSLPGCLMNNQIKCLTLQYGRLCQSKKVADWKQITCSHVLWMCCATWHLLLPAHSLHYFALFFVLFFFYLKVSHPPKFLMEISKVFPSRLALKGFVLFAW